MNRADVVRRAFALFIALTLVMGAVPYGSVQMGGPNLSPVQPVVAEPYNVTDADEETHFTQLGPGTVADQPDGVTWANDGKTMFVTGVDGDDSFESGIFQFNASTPYDVSTLSFVAERDLNTVPDADEVRALAVSDDGTSLYTVNQDSGEIKQMNLSTAYDLSTVSDHNTVNVSAQAPSPSAVAWNDDGTKLFIGGDQIHEYDASTAFDITTISHSQSASLEATAEGIDFNKSGTTLFAAHSAGSVVAEYSLSTGYDVSTMSHVANKSVHTSANVWGMDIYDGGTRFIYFEGSDDDGHVYNMMDATVSGTVTYASNQTAIEGASVTVNDSSITDTTDANGFYSVDLDNGTHTITATIDGQSGSTTVTVDGADLTDQNITIGASGLELDVKTYMEHGSTLSYKVFLTQGGETTDVTGDANTTVTSGDTSVITVDESAATLTATSDESVNQKVTITAEYNDLSTTEDVTVANKTLDNIAILPPATWPIAIIGQPGDTTGSSGTWPGAIQLQWLFVCMAVGAIVSWASVNPFMGLGATEMMLAFGWTINWISDGLLIASIIFLVYASLSLTDIASGNLGHR